MAQTDAQRRASERNLRKGNPAAFTRKETPPADPDDDDGKPPRTVRAKARKPPAKAPAKSKEPPADPAPSRGGFFGGLLDGLK